MVDKEKMKGRFIEPLFGDVTWSDNNISTTYWDNPNFQTIYEIGRNIAIKSFKMLLKVCISERDDGKVVFSHHSNLASLMRGFGGTLYSLLDSEELSPKFRKKIFWNICPSLPFAVRDIQSYLCRSSENVVKNLENLLKNNPLLKSGQKEREITEGFYWYGAINTIKSSMPYLVLNAMTYRCLERTLRGENGLESPLSELVDLF